MPRFVNLAACLAAILVAVFLTAGFPKMATAQDIADAPTPPLQQRFYTTAGALFPDCEARYAAEVCSDRFSVVLTPIYGDGFDLPAFPIPKQNSIKFAWSTSRTDDDDNRFLKCTDSHLAALEQISNEMLADSETPVEMTPLPPSLHRCVVLLGAIKSETRGEVILFNLDQTVRAVVTCDRIEFDESIVVELCRVNVDSSIGREWMKFTIRAELLPEVVSLITRLPVEDFKHPCRLCSAIENSPLRVKGDQDGRDNQ